jgi:putative ABC transport system permease protein
MRGALGFAWLTLVRQPARAALGILGVAAVGALLFDMLLLSNGLVISMGRLLDRTGYDVRVSATDLGPNLGPLIPEARDVARAIAALPSVRSAVTLRIADARISTSESDRIFAVIQGTEAGAGRPWTLLRGREPQTPRELVLDEEGAERLSAQPGATVNVGASCTQGEDALPVLPFVVVGVVEFPFEDVGSYGAGVTARGLGEACGGTDIEAAHLILITSAGDPSAAVRDIHRLRPDLVAATNAQVLSRIQQGGFTYFRQISTVLSTVTLSFALLLITVLLTVSVNQRLGEIAALRALGFSARRVVADVFWESVLIVGIGGLLSLPFGGALAVWLDTILKRIPGIPADVHFFVFEPRALVIHSSLLAATAIMAALYPMRIVARLPIAATLRHEVIS